MTVAAPAALPPLMGRASFFPGARRRRVDDPQREILIGGIGLAIMLLVFGGWAALTPLDAAVSSPGVIRAADGRERVQSFTGGQVTRVLTSNGARVRAGQPLVEFASEEAVAQERALALRVIGLQVEIDRLRAALAGAARLPVAAILARYEARDRGLAEQAIAVEQVRLSALRRLETSQQALQRDRAAQISYALQGSRRHLEATRAEAEFTRQELTTGQELLARGLTTRARVLALQRAAANYEGEIGSATSDLGRLSSQIAETTAQTVASDQSRAEEAAERLRQATAELQPLLPQWSAARAMLARSTVRAPLDGIVSTDQMPAPGTVLPAGATLFEIVPTRRDMIVEARVAVADAAEIAKGQIARVQLATLHGPTIAPVDGVIERVSADSIEDPRTGQYYYATRVKLSPAAAARITRLARVAGGLRAGTPVSVMVKTHPRSAWSYLIAPLTGRMAGMFTER
ncbi:MAG: HlyD family type I secretion periplasmic adaptor subunit [Sphingomonas sp.]|nr:HlyD family type I secretion periplasmic adaptor subunit [Sphingomonas sp.]